jgi:hypothetical protein
LKSGVTGLHPTRGGSSRWWLFAEALIGLRKKLQLVQHADSATACQGAITRDAFDSTGTVITLFRLDDDDRKIAFTFFMQDGAAGQIKVNRAALLPLGKIKVEDSPASVRIIFRCGSSLDARSLTPILYCDWSPNVLAFRSRLFHDLFKTSSISVASVSRIVLHFDSPQPLCWDSDNGNKAGIADFIPAGTASARFPISHIPFSRSQSG